MRHISPGNNLTRNFTVDSESNRSVESGEKISSSFDAMGNRIQMPHLESLQVRKSFSL
jgi:hypothetical protein